ncbi:hypothetical protein [Limosilactobacillus reuteri]|uniref:Uncharacterized protein n=1 Tax=Limosilactobacillus reuteri subsp. rodentium (strain DSM 17509 / CIP 109821 / 100-23) TaxID=349123 RepID=B3XP03_LIMR1|nr:hypothetical protein [Limosilactobacillus reuteri]EDX43539.1 hypothetical protein Lreu23DRAFT_5061 [Limosilactobacillus reuteri subsp. rodentium]MCC4475779.1 hypothetical protein [Limosilactobacillus reuteri]
MHSINEIIDEVNEDLQLQADFCLIEQEQQVLLSNGLLFFTAERIRPYITKLSDYLRETPREDRVWTIYKAADICNKHLGFYTLALINNSTCN